VLDNIILGQGGNDQIHGATGNDTIGGGDGADVLNGDTGLDTINGGAGDDQLYGGVDGDTLSGDAGNDSLYGGTGADVLNGGADFDLARYDQATAGVYARLDGMAGAGGEAVGDTFTAIEGLVGSSFADILVGSANADVLFGSLGADTLYGLGGADTLDGGAGNDNLYGGAGADALNGGADLDLARYDDATSGVYARLDGVAGSYGDAAGDTFTAMEGLVGSYFADILVGNNVNADYLFGSLGADTLYGLGGSDSLAGGAGNDLLYGGAGADRFVFDTALNAATNVDAIMDFAVNADDIVLSQAIFAGIGVTLGATEFQLGSTANDSGDRIIYNQATGQLFFDADGLGGAAQTLFATVTAGTALTIADFVMIA
jgi:serralysin